MDSGPCVRGEDVVKLPNELAGPDVVRSSERCIEIWISPNPNNKFLVFNKIQSEEVCAGTQGVVMPITEA
jgi:hypothetical protein